MDLVGPVDERGIKSKHKQSIIKLTTTKQKTKQKHKNKQQHNNLFLPSGCGSGVVVVGVRGASVSVHNNTNSGALGTIHSSLMKVRNSSRASWRLSWVMSTTKVKPGHNELQSAFLFFLLSCLVFSLLSLLSLLHCSSIRLLLSSPSFSSTLLYFSSFLLPAYLQLF